MNGAGWLRARVRAGILALLLALAGCADTGSGALGDGAADSGDVGFTGGWVESRNGCEQRLILDEGGSFSFSARIGLSGSTRLEQVEGRYTRLDGEGAPRLLFTPEREIDPAAVLYCGQWFNRGELLLDFDAIVDLGIDVGGLKLRTEISPVLGTVLVGTDPSHADRYAMYQRNDNSLVEVALSDPSPVANPLYRTDFSDPNHEVFSIEGHFVVNLPQNVWRGTFLSATPSASVAKLVLNTASASKVYFAAIAGPGLPPCDFSIYSDPTYNTLVSSFTFAPNQQSHSETYNPRNPADFFYDYPVIGNGVSAVAYTVPLSINAPKSGDCALSIRARPLVLPVLEALEQRQDAALITHSPPGPGPRLTQINAASPAGLMFGTLPAGLAPARSRLHRSVVSLLPLSADENGDPPLHDQIDLLQLKDGAITVDAGETEQGAYLNLFPDGENATALGPLDVIQDHADADGLTVPSTTSLQFASGGHARFFRLELNSAQRLAIWTEGGLKLAGELYSSSGRDLGRNSGGAPDGAGFQIVRTLPEGSYILAVRRLDAAGAYTLRVDSAAGFPFADDALGACLVEAGWAANPSVTGFNCTGRGVESLDGLEGVSSLRSIALGQNRLTNISALQSLTGLRELSLDGNEVAGLSPLAGLSRLERLGLAGNPLDANALAVLGGLGSLTHLDLRGVLTLTPSQVVTLKETLLDTLIVTPEATVLE